MDVILLTKNVVREEQSDKYMQEQFARSMVATYTTYPGAHTHTHTMEKRNAHTHTLKASHEVTLKKRNSSNNKNCQLVMESDKAL